MKRISFLAAMFGLLIANNSRFSIAIAQNTAFSYQGRILDNGTNFTGTGQFAFALVTSTNTSLQATATANAPSDGYITGYLVTFGGAGYTKTPIVTVSGGGSSGAAATATVSGGVVTAVNVSSPGNGGYTSAPTVTIAPPSPDIFYTTYWSNDGSSVDGSQPAASVSVGVTNGLFTVILGDTALPNMTAIPAAVFSSEPGLQLRIWFNDGVSGFSALSPAQNLTATPYAVQAINATSASNLLGNVEGTQISGTVGSANISGTYGNPVSFNNGGDSFTGNGTGLISVNAAALNGLNAANFWQLGGNNVSGGQFLGSMNDQAVEIWANGAPALRLLPDNSGQGEPNVIGGSPANFAGSGALGAFIGGGGATNYFGNPAGNSVYGIFGVVGGGNWDTNYANWGTLGGGQLNIVGDAASTYDAANATICGGLENLADGYAASVVGGVNNHATGFGAFIGGGGIDPGYNFAGNTASGLSSVIGGGEGNLASGTNSTVPGGENNYAVGLYSFAAGQQAQALYTGDFVWADSQNAAFTSTTSNQFLIRAQGNVGINTASPAATLDVNGTVNAASFTGTSGQVTGSQNNRSGIIIIGVPTLGPGILHVQNTSAQEPGGSGFSVVRGASPALEVFSAASPDGALYVSVTNTTDPIALFGNGNGIDCTINNNGTIVANGVTLTSDRNAKENFQPLDPQSVLAKVAALPVTEWNYKSEGRAVQHIGPVAQDFHRAFGLDGADDKHIAVVDEGGVALAAIQGLNQKLEEKDARINELEKRLNDLEQTMRVLADKK